MKLELLAFKRQIRLNNIAMDRYLNGFVSLGGSLDLDTQFETLDIQHDNLCTDVEIQKYFNDGILYIPSESKELHFKRCEDSGVEYCTCIPDKKIKGDIL